MAVQVYSKQLLHQIEAWFEQGVKDESITNLLLGRGMTPDMVEVYIATARAKVTSNKQGRDPSQIEKPSRMFKFWKRAQA